MSPVLGTTETSHDVAVTLGTAALSAFVAWLTAMWAIKGDEKRTIRDGTVRMIEFAMEYPFLESDDFCGSWPNTSRSSDDNMRYENYCCHVFNQLEHAWELFKGDKLKMRSCLDPEELIVRHRKWWEADKTNETAYTPAFRQFVDEIFRRVDGRK